MSSPTIAITQSEEEPVEPYVEAVEAAGGRSLVASMAVRCDIPELLDAVGGLLLTGGADIHPVFYGQEPDPSACLEFNRDRDEHELPLVRSALERDLPVLGICRGMQALNVALGGALIQDVPNHSAGDDEAPVFHDVFVPPGSRLTRLMGVGGFMRVNSIHHQGLILAQLASDLRASAFSLKDGIIEAVETPRHRWVVGVQWHPERGGEVSAHYQRLFSRLVEAARETGDQG